MPNFTRRTIALATLATLATALAPKDRAFAQKKYGPGVSDTEIKVGQTIAYSGPASAYGQIGQAEAAFFKMINDRGGINGRKITFISVDDSYSPPKAVEQTRRLVEQDEVAVMFGMLGTPLNLATRTYLNTNKVPQLFVAAGSEQFANPEKFPWTIGFQPTLRSEGNFFGKQILAVSAEPKIGVLYQYDDFGKELLSGLNDGLGPKATAVIAAESFAPIDPSIDSQIVKLKSAGADTVLLFSYAKQAAQAIRKIRELNWKPDIYLHSGASSVSATLVPAGLETLHRHQDRALRQGCVGSAMAGRSGAEAVLRMDQAIRAHRKSVRHLLSVRMDLRPDAGAGAAPVRRRSDARKHHAPSHQPEGFSQPGLAAGQSDQHQPHRLSGGQVYAIGAVQREDLGECWNLIPRSCRWSNELTAFVKAESPLGAATKAQLTPYLEVLACCAATFPQLLA